MNCVSRSGGLSLRCLSTDSEFTSDLSLMDGDYGNEVCTDAKVKVRNVRGHP